MKDWVVEVGFRGAGLDARANGLIQDLHEMNFKHIAFVRTASLYRIKGEFSRQQIEEIASKLLEDPITQLHTIRHATAPTPALLGAPCVEVWPKTGVTDMVGESVQLAIRDLGFPSVEQVRTGQKFHISGRLTNLELDQIAKELLANALVNDHTVHHDDQQQPNHAKA